MPDKPHLRAQVTGNDPIAVTVSDPVTGEEATATVQPGDYALICAEPCYIEHTQADFESGTVTITIRGYRRRRRG